MSTLALDAEALYGELLRGVRPLVDMRTHLVGVTSGGAWLAQRLQVDLGLSGAAGSISSTLRRMTLPYTAPLITMAGITIQLRYVLSVASLPSRVATLHKFSCPFFRLGPSCIFCPSYSVHAVGSFFALPLVERVAFGPRVC